MNLPFHLAGRTTAALTAFHHKKAEAQLQPTVYEEQKRAIAYYVMKGDQQRAHVIATIHPDINDIRDIAMGSQFEKGIAMEDVVHTYIVRAYAQAIRAQKAPHK